MAKPVILSIDDDPQVLAAVERDLRTRYGKDYRIVKAESGAAALEAISEFKRRGDTVALMVADQRMPTMTGTEFLLEALQIYPMARRVLLTAYADTTAAIQAINDVGLDHYLMKPWDPPETHLYPILDDLLEDWQAAHNAGFDGIRVIGTTWSPTTFDAKDFLARNEIPYRFIDVERDEEATATAKALDGLERLPVVVFPDGSHLLEPSRRDLAAKLGMQTEATGSFYDVLVIGAGPAGLAAGVYGASEGLKIAIVEREATGGQAGTSSRIENYLGFPKGIAGVDLARRAAAQATRFGAEIVTAGDARKVRVEGPTKVVTLADETELRAKALIVASGMTVRRLGAEDVDRLTGAGVYYGAAIAEAPLYTGAEVIVVGGANSAGQAAVMLSRFASKVTLVVRSDSVRKGMSSYLVDQIEAIPSIEIITGASVAEIRGERRVEGVVLRTGDGDEERAVSAVFVFIGALPHTDFIEGVVALNKSGFVLTGPDLGEHGRRPKWPLERNPYLMETSEPGIFAAGDVRHGAVRRVASAVGQGSVCVSFVHQYLETT
jgi:thioredoxin reductase (NADPH)